MCFLGLSKTRYWTMRHVSNIFVQKNSVMTGLKSGIYLFLVTAIVLQGPTAVLGNTIA